MTETSAPFTPAQATRGQIGTNDLVLVITGMGPKRARSAASAALLNSDTSSKSSMCGGLSQSLAETDVVVYTDCLSTDSNQGRQQCSRQVTDRLASLLHSRNLPCTRVTLITATRVATRPKEKAGLAQTGAEAVDMESYEIISAAALAGVPSAVVRVVSDSVDRKMPNFNRAMTPDGRTNPYMAAAVCLIHPIATARLFSISRRTIQRLGQVAEIIFAADCYSDLSSQ